MNFVAHDFSMREKGMDAKPSFAQNYTCRSASFLPFQYLSILPLWPSPVPHLAPWLSSAFITNCAKHSVHIWCSHQLLATHQRSLRNPKIKERKPRAGVRASRLIPLRGKSMPCNVCVLYAHEFSLSHHIWSQPPRSHDDDGDQYWLA